LRHAFIVRVGDADWYKELCEAYEQALTAQQAAEQRAEARAAELKAAHPQSALGDRITFPRPLVEAWRADAEDFGRVLGQAAGGKDARGRTVAAGASTLERLRDAATTVSTRQLAQLSTAELRALFATFRVFASTGDNGKRFNTSAVQVPIRLFCTAASVPLTHGKARRDLFAGLDKLSSRRVTTWARMPNADGTVTLAAIETVLVEMVPVWDKLEKARADHLAELWEFREPGRWDWELPSTLVLKLPPATRQTLGALVFPADALERLETGARAVRGTRGVLPMDVALLVEIAQTRQAQQVDTAVGSLRSYVDREAFLKGFFGADRLDELAAQDHGGRADARFEASARALVEGGLVAKWEPAKAGRRGARDVFVLHADALPGTADRVKLATKKGSRKPAR
jgi:hypothetical protein